MAVQAADDPIAQWLKNDGLVTLDALLGEAVDSIGVMDRDMIFRFVNWTGPTYSRESVVGQNALSFLPPDQVETGREAYTRALRTGTKTRFEFVYRNDHGVRLWEIRVGPIRFGGEIVGLIVVATDMTEQRRAQVDRDRFFSLSLDMLVVTNRAGTLKRLNPAFGQALGYEVTDLIETPCIVLVHPEDRTRTLEAFERVLGGAPTLDLENRYRRRDGTYRVFSWRATSDPVTGDVYAVVRDVTDQRSVEAQLRHAQKMDAIGQLAGGVAHDFNNLLLAVVLNVEMARNLVPPHSEVTKHLDEVDHAAQRATALTRQLLAFSRRQVLHSVPMDLNSLIDGTIRLLKRILPESITIDWVPGLNLASVNADSSQLEQVIVNLCVNARDAMEQGGRLTIETENVLVNRSYLEAHPWAKPGRYVLLSVTDTGVGMPPEVRSRIFEPFFTTKAPQRGTGLGLATLYGIVRQHEGMVQVYSEPGTGTTFKVYLPADSRLAAHVDDELEAPAPRGTETILIAEDEEQIRRAVVRILEGAGYRVIAVDNGMDAVRLLREAQHPIDLVLLDIVMPMLGGPGAWEMTKGLRAGLRVVFVTGYADDRYRAQLPPDAELLEKPFRPAELLRRVRRVLDQGRGAATTEAKPT